MGPQKEKEAKSEHHFISEQRPPPPTAPLIVVHSLWTLLYLQQKILAWEVVLLK